MDIKTHSNPTPATAGLTPRAETALRVAKAVAARETLSDSGKAADAAERFYETLVKKAAPELRDPFSVKLQLDIDRETNLVIGRVVDKETGEVIKQIPSEEMLKLIASSEDGPGAIIDKSF